MTSTSQLCLAYDNSSMLKLLESFATCTRQLSDRYPQRITKCLSHYCLFTRQLSDGYQQRITECLSHYDIEIIVQINGVTYQTKV